MFSFRRAAIEDIEIIQTIAHATWPSTYEPILGKEQVVYMLELMYSNAALEEHFIKGHLFYLLYKGDDIAGFASFSLLKGSTWKLHKIYILPQHQRTGAGEALLNFIINKISSLDGNRLLLNVNRFNKARYFYEKNGFTIVEEINIDIGNGFFMSDFIMKLEIEKQ